MRGGIEMRRNGADHCITHAVEQVVGGDVAGADQLDAGFVEPALGELLDESTALAGGHEYEDRVGLGVARALQERREIRILERNADRFRELAARRGEAFLERCL